MVKNPVAQACISGRRLMAHEALGVVRIAPQVLSTIVTNAALEIPGVVRMAHSQDPWTRWLGREVPRQGVSLLVRENSVSADLYLVVEAGVDVVTVGAAVQEEVAAAIEHIVGMQVREVNIYIQDVA
jgi:uncharacterized alkaline shock family protein YloU